jgi:hypothetical protein
VPSTIAKRDIVYRTYIVDEVAAVEGLELIGLIYVSTTWASGHGPSRTGFAKCHGLKEEVSLPVEVDAAFDRPRRSALAFSHIGTE